MPAEPPRINQASENNKQSILEQLLKVLAPNAKVLEIASGAGVHARHFAAAMPGVEWQPSDREFETFGLVESLGAETLPNIKTPILLDIAQWPNLVAKYDAAYSANCIHVIPEQLLEPYVDGCAKSLAPAGAMLLYGPFKYADKFTTRSNADFDEFLRASYPGGGIRDFEEIDRLAGERGMQFVSDTPMPSNNQFLVWRKA